MFKYFGRDKKIIKAVELASQVLRDDRFYRAIENAKPFDDTNITNDLISRCIREVSHNDFAIINIYKPWNRCLSKVSGRFKPRYPDVIELNHYYILKAEPIDIASLICHEFIHFTDHRYPSYNFGHTGNSRASNLATTPYMINVISTALMESYIKS